jgi:TnpA family transposase
MPRLKILSASEQNEFDNPPILSGEIRKTQFRFNQILQEMITPIKGDIHQVGFVLMFYYFKTAQKFFLPQLFRPQDIEYVSRQLKILDFKASDFRLDKHSFKRYRHKILQYYGCSPFDKSAQILLYQKIYLLAASHVKPKVIFNDCIDLLLVQKIEIPKYNAIHSVILSTIKDYTISVLQSLTNCLSENHIALLDELLSFMEDKMVYKLTSLKSFNHSIRPKAIKENAKELSSIHDIHDKLLPIVKTLPLNTRGIEYFATTVLKSDIFRVKRKADIDKYLHLITFVVYQYSILHDALMDILLKSIASFNSSAKREHQNKCYENRTKYASTIKDFNAKNLMQIDLIKGIYSLCKDHHEDYYTKCKNIENVIEAFFSSKNHTELNQVLIISESDYNDSGYYHVISDKSRSLQSKLTPILNVLKFNAEQSSAKELLKAVEYFQEREGKISSKSPMSFLTAEEQSQVLYENRFDTSLYKALLFRKVSAKVKSGSLNLVSSYKFRALDEYLIPKDEWAENKQNLIRQAGLEQFQNSDQVLLKLETILNQEYIKTNDNIISGANKYIKVHKANDFTITTPALESLNTNSHLSDYFPEAYTVSMQEVLFSVNKLSGFLNCFDHIKQNHNKRIPEKLLIAGIMSLGYGMGNNEIASIAKGISRSALDNTVNWCFTTENVRNAIDNILKLTIETSIPDLYLEAQQKIHTSSDGQKWKVINDSLNANYSFKYYGQDQGVTVNSFIDRRNLLFYSTVMSSSLREAGYVIDGLMHNDVVKSEIHSTDTHGYSEVVFGITHFLSVFFAPRIKGLKYQVKSMFSGYRSKYKAKSYEILPTHTINVRIIKEMYDDILRFVATIKLKRSTASQLLSRLNSYSKQHKLYQALKEFGKIIKSRFILKYLNELDLRQSIEKQLSLVENNNKFSKAVSQENDKSFVQQLQSEQIIAESCRRLMKAAIICWNCLFLHNKIHTFRKQEEAQNIIKTIKAGSIMMWRHINFRGLYDFSEEMIMDKFDLKLDRSKPLQAI